MLSSSSEGQIVGDGSWYRTRGRWVIASFMAMSPGRAITETPRLEIAVCIAISSTRGIWLGSDTSSQ